MLHARYVHGGLHALLLAIAAWSFQVTYTFGETTSGRAPLFAFQVSRLAISKSAFAPVRHAAMTPRKAGGGRVTSCERRDLNQAPTTILPSSLPALTAAAVSRRMFVVSIGFGAFLSKRSSALAAVPSVSWPPAASGTAPEPPALRDAVVSRTKQDQPWQKAKPMAAPRGEKIVRREVDLLVKQDPEIAAALLRLAFHDATSRDTVTGEGGANGSIMLEEELARRENYGLDKAVKLLEPIQQASSLSMADTIALAGAQAVASAGGPVIRVTLGRIDAAFPDPQKLSKPVGACEEASVAGGGRDCRGVADTTVPGAGLNSDGIRNYFGRLGFGDDEIVALMGGHTIGRFTTLLGLPKDCLKDLNSKWRQCLPLGQRLPFVSVDPNTFSNSYYKYLLLWNAKQITPGDVHFLPTDVVLVVDRGFRQYVERFAVDEKAFFDTFTRAYTRLVSIGT